MGTAQKAGGGSEASEATIAVPWKEEEYFYRPEWLIQQANLKDPSVTDNMNVGDITTLANPDIVEGIRVQVQGKGPVVLKEGPEDIHQFGKVE